MYTGRFVTIAVILILILIAAAVCFLPKSIELKGDVKTEYVYDEEFVLPSVFSTSLIPFLNSKIVNPSDLKVSGFNNQKTGKQTVTIKYYYLKLTYEVTVYERILSAPALKLDGFGILTVTGAENDYKYLDNFGISVNGTELAPGYGQKQNWGKEGAAMRFDLTAALRDQNAPDGSDYVVTVFAKGAAASPYVAASDSVSLDFSYYSLGSEDFGVMSGVFHSYSSSAEFDKIKLGWLSSSKIGRGSYQMNITFFRGSQVIDSQKRTAPNQPAGESGVIALNRLVDHEGGTLLADKLEIVFTAIGAEGTIFNLTEQAARTAARYTIEILPGTLSGEDDYILSITREGGV